jgi:hypothetical protein
MLQQELTAYLNLTEESYFPEIYGGLKLNKSVPTNDFWSQSIKMFTKNLVIIYEWKFRGTKHPKKLCIIKGEAWQKNIKT